MQIGCESRTSFASFTNKNNLKLMKDILFSGSERQKQDKLYRCKKYRSVSYFIANQLILWGNLDAEKDIGTVLI